jgi:hypothetical protein
VDDAQLTRTRQHVADHGYRSSRDATEPEPSARRRDLIRLEEFFRVEPAGNSFEGFHTLRVYNLLAFRPDLRSSCPCTATCCRSSNGCSIPAA